MVCLVVLAIMQILLCLLQYAHCSMHITLCTSGVLLAWGLWESEVKNQYLDKSRNTSGVRMASACTKNVPDRPLIDWSLELLSYSNLSTNFIFSYFWMSCKNALVQNAEKILFYHIKISKKSHFVLWIS